MDKKRRIIMCIAGVLLSAVSVAFFRMAAFGVDPFQSLVNGMGAVVPMPFGTLYALVNLCLLIAIFMLDRHYIGIATFINLFLLGYVIQFSLDILRGLMPEPAMAYRLAFMTAGIVLLCIASSMYFTADLGVSAYDAVSLIMSRKWTGMPFRYCRCMCDCVCAGIGTFLLFWAGMGGRQVAAFVGAGTVVTAFFMGPLIEFFNLHISRPLLNKKWVFGR